MLDVVVVGGGPSGLAAAHTCHRWGLDTHLVSEYLGGRTNFHLKLPFVEADDFVGGSSLAASLRDGVRLLGLARTAARIDQIEATDGGLRLTGLGLEPLEARVAIVATGVRPETLNVPGEKRFIMRGLAYSCTWYAPLLAGRVAAIIGTGPRAIQAARHLSAFARLIYLIGPSLADLARLEARQLAQAPNLNLLPGWEPRAVEGADRLERLRLTRGDDEQVLDVDAVFVCRGIRPNSDLVAGVAERDLTGAIKVDSAQRTSHHRLLAAGDVTDSLSEQVLIALGAGARAGLTACEILGAEGRPTVIGGRPRLTSMRRGPHGHASNGH